MSVPETSIDLNEMLKGYPEKVKQYVLKEKIEMLEKIIRTALGKARKAEESSGDYYPEVNYIYEIRAEIDKLRKQIKED